MGERIRFTNPGGTWGSVICVCVLVGVVCVVLGWGSGLSVWERVWEGVVVLYVCVCCESGLFVFMGGPGICIMFLFGPIANHTCLEEVSEEVRENRIKHDIYIYIYIKQYTK